MIEGPEKRLVLPGRARVLIARMPARQRAPATFRRSGAARPLPDLFSGSVTESDLFDHSSAHGLKPRVARPRVITEPLAGLYAASAITRRHEVARRNVGGLRSAVTTQTLFAHTAHQMVQQRSAIDAAPPVYTRSATYAYPRAITANTTGSSMTTYLRLLFLAFLPDGFRALADFFVFGAGRGRPSMRAMYVCHGFPSLALVIAPIRYRAQSMMPLT